MKKPSLPDIGQYNVLFGVTDSCRYDTAESAKTPFFSSVSRLRHAEAPATYTLPSHVSFFNGNLPVLIDGDPEFLPGIHQIWRSCSAGVAEKSVGISFSASTIVDYYVQNNYAVVGTGGVSFFSSAEYNILPRLFPHFIHFERPRDLYKHTNLPRGESQFPLANIEKIAKAIDPSKPFFTFVNCPETHVPYDSPNVHVTDEYREAIRKIYEVDKIKHCSVPTSQRLTDRERYILMEAQKISLEWIDNKLKQLHETIRNKLPTLVLVMSDHGDEFGEGDRYGHAHFHPTVMNIPLWCGIIP